jgi:hypothetical protein
MEDKVKKKRTALIIYLICLFILFLGAGVYYFIKQNNKTSSEYILNKYQDTVNWCSKNEDASHLTLKCNSLLLNIQAIGDNRTCFEVQIITQNSEFKNISICEDSSIVTHTNEVLAYKKLMPVEIILSYTKEKNNYTLSTVDFSPLDSAYLQTEVNKDIASLVTIDPSTSTIENSVDFCPKPDTLPSYVTEENKTAYTKYYNKNILSEKEYSDLLNKEFETLFLNNWTSPTIKLLFACDSANRMGYSTICNNTLDSKYKKTELSTLPAFVSDWNNTSNTESDLISLKNLSLIYDGMLYKKTHKNYSSTWVISDLFKFITDANNNQNVYCSGYKVFEKLAKYNSTAESQLEKLRTSVTNNFSSASSICLDILDKNLYSKDGLYLKALNTTHTPELYIYEKCNNLYQLMTNE